MLRLIFFKGFIFRFVLISMVVLSISTISIMAFDKKDIDGMVSVKEVKNTPDNYGGSEDIHTLVTRIDGEISEIFKILHSRISH